MHLPAGGVSPRHTYLVSLVNYVESCRFWITAVCVKETVFVVSMVIVPVGIDSDSLVSCVAVALQLLHWLDAAGATALFGTLVVSTDGEHLGLRGRGAAFELHFVCEFAVVLGFKVEVPRLPLWDVHALNLHLVIRTIR